MLIIVQMLIITESKYFGIFSAINFALFGATSLGLMITQFPAAIALMRKRCLVIQWINNI